MNAAEESLELADRALAWSEFLVGADIAAAIVLFQRCLSDAIPVKYKTL